MPVVLVFPEFRAAIVRRRRRVEFFAPKMDVFSPQYFWATDFHGGNN